MYTSTRYTCGHLVFQKTLDAQLPTVIVDTYEKLQNAKTTNTHLPDMFVGNCFTVFIELF